MYHTEKRRGMDPKTHLESERYRKLGWVHLKHRDLSIDVRRLWAGLFYISSPEIMMGGGKVVSFIPELDTRIN